MRSETELRLRANIAHAVTRVDRRREKKPGYNRYALAKYLDTGEKVADAILSGDSPEDAARRFCHDQTLINAICRAARESGQTKGAQS